MRTAAGFVAIAVFVFNVWRAYRQRQREQETNGTRVSRLQVVGETALGFLVLLVVLYGIGFF